MTVRLHTISRDGLYEAEAEYDGELVVIKAGSRINTKKMPGYKPSKQLNELYLDNELITSEGIINKDICFSSLSASASFVTGRNANGMITWKTEDNKNVRNLLRQSMD